MTNRIERDRAATGIVFGAVIGIGMWIILGLFAGIAFSIYAWLSGVDAGELQVTATIEELPVTIEVPNDAEGVTITSEEIAAWCEEFGLFTGECLIDPAEVRAWTHDDNFDHKE